VPLEDSLLFIMSNEGNQLLFGPANDQPDASSLFVDLNDLFAGEYIF
jgi:hypothetical protein